MYVFQDPPPIWISRAIKLPSYEIFQHSFCWWSVDFFWNNPFYEMKFGDFIDEHIESDRFMIEYDRFMMVKRDIDS